MLVDIRAGHYEVAHRRELARSYALANEARKHQAKKNPRQGWRRHLRRPVISARPLPLDR